MCIFFEIKRGEQLGPGIVITNETAGPYLMAFDLKEPWATRRRYNIFGDKHAEIFARPEVTADRIVMCHIINEAVESCLPEIENQLCAKYVLTRYALIYCLRLVMEADESSKNLLKAPEALVLKSKDRERFREIFRHVVSDMVTDLNFELQELGEDFDYREKMRSSQWVQNLARKIVGDHIKMIKRKKIKSIAEEWTAPKRLERSAAGN